MQFGTKVTGKRQALHASAADIATNPGEVYELTIHTDGIPDENVAITQALSLESQVADLKVLYVETHPDNTITLQFMDAGPGSISLGGLFTLMPAIFVLAGIVIAGYLVYRLYFSESGWLLPAIIIIGGALAVFFFTSEKFFTGISQVTVRKGKDKEEKDVQKSYNLREAHTSAKTEYDRLQKIEDYWETQKVKASEEIRALPKDKNGKIKDQSAKDRWVDTQSEAVAALNKLKPNLEAAKNEQIRLRKKLEE